MKLSLITAIILAANSPFYKDKTMPGTGGTISCCKNKDCRPVNGWRLNNSIYEVLMDGIWHIPPQHLIKHIQTPDGKAHACFKRGYGARINFFCVFIPVSVT